MTAVQSVTLQRAQPSAEQAGAAADGWSRTTCEAVNRLIVDRLHSPVELIPQLAGTSSRGRRQAAAADADAGSPPGCAAIAATRHIRLAACVEFIHTATLLHDDVVDESDLRRGLATANAVWGNKPSVLVGDFLFSRAFQLMVEDGSLAVLAILSNASAVIAEGEVAAARSPRTTPNQRAGLSRGHPLQDGARCSRPPAEIGAVVGRPAGGGGRRRCASYGDEPRHRLPADRRRARLQRAAQASSARASATTSATARSRCP